MGAFLVESRGIFVLQKSVLVKLYNCFLLQRDTIFSDMRNDFGVSSKCDQVANIINQIYGSVSFILMERAAKERNKRNSERLLALSALGQHPWQQPDFIERKRKHLLALFAAGEHPFQPPPELIESNREQNSVRQLALSDIGEHNFQHPDVIKSNREH